MISKEFRTLKPIAPICRDDMPSPPAIDCSMCVCNVSVQMHPPSKFEIFGAQRH